MATSRQESNSQDKIELNAKLWTLVNDETTSEMQKLANNSIYPIRWTSFKLKDNLAQNIH